MISNSGHDENGKAVGGFAGDQTGTEWQIRSWYNRPWDCVLRYPDLKVGALIAELAIEAANNNNIGYDQGNRDSFWAALQAAKYRPANITIKCESDCSAGVIAITKAVGHLLGLKKLQNLTATYTGNMKAAYKAAGFSVFTAKKYLTSDDYLLPGDILLSEAHHTATNITAGRCAESAVDFVKQDKTIDQLAAEVINGDWGNDPARSQKLTAAGYDAAAVQKKVNELVAQASAVKPAAGKETRPATTTPDAAGIYKQLLEAIGNVYGVCGLMGNLYAESALLPVNLQNSFEKKLKHTDRSYTDAVDSGSYDNFDKDSAGYGLAQWTYWTRKRGLRAYAESVKSSIGNQATQIEYLLIELNGNYAPVLRGLKTAKTVREASDLVLTKFEQPADQGESVQALRASYGRKYLEMFAGDLQPAAPAAPAAPAVTKPTRIDYAAERDKTVTGLRRFKTTTNLRLRAGAGIDKPILATLTTGAGVVWYGYFTTVKGTRWLYVETSAGTGFVCSSYLMEA